MRGSTFSLVNEIRAVTTEEASSSESPKSGIFSFSSAFFRRPRSKIRGSFSFWKAQAIFVLATFLTVPYPSISTAVDGSVSCCSSNP